ncbi:hypothetical protein OKW33_002911 [Paraburkholderia atlantica]|nr:hypothetical protein [Paraburkholderia atlantica]
MTLPRSAAQARMSNRKRAELELRAEDSSRANV